MNVMNIVNVEEHLLPGGTPGSSDGESGLILRAHARCSCLKSKAPSVTVLRKSAKNSCRAAAALLATRKFDRPNQTDQDTLPPYQILDQVLSDY